MTSRLACLAFLVLALGSSAWAQVEAIDLAATPFEARAAVPPLLALAIATDADEAARSSWPVPYQPNEDYEGYFHHGLCYSTVQGVFVPVAAADASHYCQDKAWSGNLLNWASMSALDTLRYALTGGARFTDDARLTVLERADLGEGLASTSTKSISAAQVDIARLTPWALPQLSFQSCGKRLQIFASAEPAACKGKQPATLLADLPLRVQVCQGEDQRATLCHPYGRYAKPEGLLQAASSWLRIAVQSGPAEFIGGGLIGARALALDWTRPENPQPEWNLRNGIVAKGKTVLRELAGSSSAKPLAADDAALLQAAQAPQSGLLRATCQKTHALRWPPANSAGDGAQQLKSLRQTFARILRETQLAALPARNALVLARNRLLYVADTSRSDLSSTLSRSELLVAEDGKLVLPEAVQWQASVDLPSERRLFTTAAQGQVIALAAGSLSAATMESLRRSPHDLRQDGLLLQRLAWLRGDPSSQERNGGQLANRATPFGSQLAGKLAFMESAGNPEAGLLFMTTGDGMLHAVDAASGRESFAWMPQATLARLAASSAPDYPAMSLLDGGLGLALRSRQGKNLTLATMAGGHSLRAIFALEMVNEFDPQAKQWRALEFTAAQDERLGNVLHAPQLVRIATRQGSAVVLKPFLLFSAGVNVNAGLFLLALDQEAGAPWIEGSNLFYIPATVTGNPVGSHLAPPALVLGDDQRLLYAWAGDGQGRLWRFSFEESAKVAAGFKSSVNLVFSARSATGQAQIISVAPRVAYASDKSYMVLFGSGRWLEFSDAAPGNAGQESFYGVLDRLSNSTVKRADLAPRREEAIEGGYRVKGVGQDVASVGWVIDFPEVGERVTDSALLEGGRVLVNTRIPPQDPCLPLRQRGWDFDVLQGSNETLAGRDITRTLQLPMVMRLSSSAALDAFGRRAAGTTGVFMDLPAPGQTLEGKAIQETLPSGRLAWREIANWSRLHEAAQSKP